MILVCSRNGSPFVYQTCKISRQLSSYTASATITLYVPAATPAALPSNLDEIHVDDTDTGTRYFGGYVTNFTLTDDRAVLNGVAQVGVSITCRDYRMITDAAIITKTYTAQQDSAIIADAFSTAGVSSITMPSGSLAAIDLITATFSANTLTEVMNQICGQTGGSWYIDANKSLHYIVDDYTHTPAPFGLSDTPNLSTTFPFQGAANYSANFSTPCNYLIVNGGIDTTGYAAISVTLQDTVSQAKYGVWKAIYQDNLIESTAQATLIGQQYMASMANPRRTMSVVCWQPGLDIGMMVPVTKAGYSFSAVPLQVQQITLDATFASGVYAAQFTLQLGDYLPNFANEFRKVAAIVNTVFDPVIPYTPIQEVTIASVVPTGSGVQTWTSPIFNVSSKSGKLIYASVYCTAPISGPRDASSNPISVGVGIQIQIDGQTAVTYWIVPYGLSYNYNPELLCAFTPGVMPASLGLGGLPVATGSGGCLQLELEHANALVVSAVFKTSAPVSTGSVGAYHFTAVRAERAVPL